MGITFIFPFGKVTGWDLNPEPIAKLMWSLWQWGNQPRGNEQNLMVAQGKGRFVSEVTGIRDWDRLVINRLLHPHPPPSPKSLHFECYGWNALLIHLSPAECLKAWLNFYLQKTLPDATSLCHSLMPSIAIISSWPGHIPYFKGKAEGWLYCAVTDSGPGTQQVSR